MGLFLLTRISRFAASMLEAGLVVLGFLVLNTLPEALLRSLESGFNVAILTQGDQYAGVIVLGDATGRPNI